MFFSDGFGRAPHVEYAYNLVLFKEIKRFYIYRDIVGTEAFLLNTAGNVVCFMPFGFFLPIISPRFGKWYLMLILSFLLTLSIETIQLVFKVGSFDVDDMFLNTLGGIAGYLCQWIISYIRKPMAEHGYLCLGLAGVGLLLCVAGMAFSVRSQGNTPVGALSMCFSSILFSVASLMYGWKSFKEEEKNYIFAKIGTILSGLLVIWWIVTILIGIRG